MGKADFHIHSSCNDGTASVRQIFDYVRDHTDLDVVAITDHDRMRGTYEALELAPEYPFDVIPGVEITTLSGHLLALFVEQPISMWRGIEWTLCRIHEQGGLAIVPHPMSPLTRSIGQSVIERVMRKNDRSGVHFDAIELFNPSIAGHVTADKARRLNQQYRLPTTGGSDSHDLPTIGTAWTEFEGDGAAALRSAITTGRTGYRGSWWGWDEHMHTARLKARKFLTHFGAQPGDQFAGRQLPAVRPRAPRGQGA